MNEHALFEINGSDGLLKTIECSAYVANADELTEVYYTTSTTGNYFAIPEISSAFRIVAIINGQRIQLPIERVNSVGTTVTTDVLRFVDITVPECDTDYFEFVRTGTCKDTNGSDVNAAAYFSTMKDGVDPAPGYNNLLVPWFGTGGMNASKLMLKVKDSVLTQHMPQDGEVRFNVSASYHSQIVFSQTVYGDKACIDFTDVGSYGSYPYYSYIDEVHIELIFSDSTHDVETLSKSYLVQ